MCDCLVCSRIEQIRRGENPYFVEELSTGYVVLGDYQRFPGYTLFYAKSTPVSCIIWIGNSEIGFSMKCL